MRLELWQILLLAVVQGATEFLPVSSSGHLVILANLLATGDAPVANVADLNIVLHLGTLASIVVYYARRLLHLLVEDRRTLVLLSIGTVPAVAVGLPVKKFASQAVLENPLLAGVMLLVTGAMLWWISGRRPGQRDYRQLGYGDALWIGLSQAAAILPGLSRSGATIAAGLERGLAPESAATFSFLLAVPVISGAGLLELLSLGGQSPQSATPLPHLAAGAAVSFGVGLVSLWWLVRWLERGRLRRFALWCIPLGLLVIAWQLLGGG